jgi:hypothetical protein
MLDAPTLPGIVAPVRTMTRVERLDEVARVARAMRTAQRHYYRHRRREDLIESKTLETRLDTLLSELLLVEPVFETPAAG